MTMLTIIPGKITALDLAALLAPFGDLPVVVRIPRSDGHEDHVLETGRTDISKKFAQDTDYGDIDLMRIMVDGEDIAVGEPLSASLMAASLKTHDPVKFVVYGQDACFLIGTDVKAERAETEDRTICRLTMADANDA